jgi:hypothetical protein
MPRKTPSLVVLKKSLDAVNKADEEICEYLKLIEEAMSGINIGVVAEAALGGGYRLRYMEHEGSWRLVVVAPDNMGIKTMAQASRYHRASIFLTALDEVLVNIEDRVNQERRSAPAAIENARKLFEEAFSGE